MSISQRLMGSGFSAQQAVNVAGDQSAALTATGTSSQANALQLTAVNNYVGTTAANSGVKLPAASPGDSIYVYNAGANTLSVYGQGTEAIGAGGASAAFSVATNRGCIFQKLTDSLWGTVYGA